MQYNPSFLDNIDIFNNDELEVLEKLNSKMKLGDIKNNEKVLDKFIFDFIYTSAKIEGNTYTIEETLTLLESKIPARNKNIKDGNMILNLNEAVRYTLDNKLNIDKHTIQEIHQILTQGLLEKKSQGIVRNKIVFISGSEYEPSSIPAVLEDGLNAIIKNYNNIENPYNKAVYLHNNMAYLMYFRAGNKKTARVLQNLSLINDGKMFIPLNANDSSIEYNYKKALLKYYAQGDYSLYKQFFIDETKRINGFFISINTAKQALSEAKNNNERSR